jgi:hypothetical protein
MVKRKDKDGGVFLTMLFILFIVGGFTPVICNL